MNTVQLIGFYGSDEIHGLAAWVSTQRILTEERRRRLPAFLKQLAESGHGTPFEKSFLHFLITCDTASHIHLLKHRIGVSANGESARYRELKEDKYYVSSDWPPDEQEQLARWVEEGQKLYHETLARLTPVLGRKRAKESARFYLPYSHQINLDVSFNFRSFMHFQNLRNSEHAQKEIQSIADTMIRLVRETGAFPYSLAAFGY